MNLVPKEEIQKRAASSALIGVLHPTIAMTRMRLQELILINNPHLKNNSFVTSHKKLSILLTRALFFASIE